MTRRGLVSVVAALAAAACADVSPSEPEGTSPSAAVYLERALDIMESHSIKRYEIDWPVFRAVAVADASNAQTTFDTHAAIRTALELLGDNHSFFISPSPSGPHPVAAAKPAPVDPRTALIEPEVGYLDVPAFSGGGSQADDLATSYHAIIGEIDQLGACRWLVDVRGNTGGNMWPMLAGVGPILGEGVAGHFIDADAVVQAWSYYDGASTLAGGVITTASPAFELSGSPPPVAVLTDATTASSGEAIAIAFRGRADTRSFGDSTWGVSTANATFLLSDGAVIALTVSTMADRSGSPYGAGVGPDVLVQGIKTGDRSTDAALDAALVWLTAQPCG